MSPKIASVGVVRIAGMGARLAVGLVIARLLGAAEVGEYFLAVAAAGFLGMVLLGGLERLALSEIGNSPHQVRLIAMTLGRLVMVGSITGAVVGSAGLVAAGELWGAFPRWTIAITLLGIIPMNLVVFTGHVLRGAQHSTQALVVSELIPPAGRLIIFLVLPVQMGATRAAIAFGLGWIVAGVVGLRALGALGPDPAGGAPWMISKPWAQGRPLLLFALNQQLQQSWLALGAWVFGTPSQVGALGVASRMQGAALVPVTASRFVTAPHLSSASERLPNSVQRLAVKSARVGALWFVPLATVLFLFSEDLMSLFGEDFVSGTPYLRILLVGSVVNALTGSTAQTLLMSRQRSILAVTAFGGSVVTIGVSLLIGPFWGVTAMAFSASAAVVCMGLAEWGAIQSRLGARVDVFAPLQDSP